jgi:hypothetical protein
MSCSKISKNFGMIFSGPGPHGIDVRTTLRNCRRVKQLLPRRSITMTSTFLHYDKATPADELVNANARHARTAIHGCGSAS